MSRVLASANCRHCRLRAVLGKHPLGLTFAVVGLVVALAAAGGGAQADPAHSDVVGHVTVAPGQTLWGIAVAHAPAGTDPRAYLLRLRDVNGLDGRPVPAWTVVFLPHPAPARHGTGTPSSQHR
ncbi:MAG: hypothetical protein M3O70_14640 [Actinomycetota bacterium]|nr:hypothetical protein [Actinomycetota bacterium]